MELIRVLKDRSLSSLLEGLVISLNKGSGIGDPSRDPDLYYLNLLFNDISTAFL